MPAVPAVAEGAGQLEDLDEPPEPRVRGGSGRAGLMKPLVVLALPGMYLFYKYSQYRREQRELWRRRVTERELQHLHHKIDKLLTKLEENEPELASSQEDEFEVTEASSESDSRNGSGETTPTVRGKRSPQDESQKCPPPPMGSDGMPLPPPPGEMPQCGPPPNMDSMPSGDMNSDTRAKRFARGPQPDDDQGGAASGGTGGGFGEAMANGMQTMTKTMGDMAKTAGNMMGGAMPGMG